MSRARDPHVHESTSFRNLVKISNIGRRTGVISSVQGETSVTSIQLKIGNDREVGDPSGSRNSSVHSQHRTKIFTPSHARREF